MKRSIGFDFDICCQEHESEQHSKDFNCCCLLKSY